MKNARRIFAIVSTTSIPKPAPMFPMEATVDPSSPGSRLDADHPENGVLIPCLFTVDRRAVSGDTILRLAADDGGVAPGGPSRQPQAGAAADAADRPPNVGPEAKDQRPISTAPGLPLPAARPEDRPTKPSMGRRPPT